MIKNKCLVCGGFDFRADRALAGRLICISCGNPYGIRKISRNNNLFFFRSKKIVFIIILLLVIFIIVVT